TRPPRAQTAGCQSALRQRVLPLRHRPNASPFPDPPATAQAALVRQPASGDEACLRWWGYSYTPSILLFGFLLHYIQRNQSLSKLGLQQLQLLDDGIAISDDIARGSAELMEGRGRSGIHLSRGSLHDLEMGPLILRGGDDALPRSHDSSEE